MAKIQFQEVLETNIATTDSVTTDGMLTFSERCIYLGLGNGKKVLYDGISPINYIKSIEIDNLPTDTEGEDGELRIVKSTNEIYLKSNGVWNSLGKSTDIPPQLDITGNPNDISSILVNPLSPIYNSDLKQLTLNDDIYLAKNSTATLSYVNGVINRGTNDTALMSLLFFNPQYKIIIFEPQSVGLCYNTRADSTDDINGNFGLVSIMANKGNSIITYNNQTQNVLKANTSNFAINQNTYIVLFNNTQSRIYFCSKDNSIEPNNITGLSGHLNNLPDNLQLGISVGLYDTTLEAVFDSLPATSIIKNPIGIINEANFVANFENPTNDELKNIIIEYNKLTSLVTPLNS